MVTSEIKRFVVWPGRKWTRAGDTSCCPRLASPTLLASFTCFLELVQDYAIVFCLLSGRYRTYFDIIVDVLLGGGQ